MLESQFKRCKEIIKKLPEEVEREQILEDQLPFVC